MKRAEPHVAGVLSAAAALHVPSVTSIASAILVDAGEIPDTRWRNDVLRHMLVQVKAAGNLGEGECVSVNECVKSTNELTWKRLPAFAWLVS